MKNNIRESFMEQMVGGAFIYRADEGHEILYANQNLVELFECETYEEFLEFVGGSFDGMVNDTSSALIMEEIDQQLFEAQNGSGYVFYNVRTKKGNKRRLVNHWTLVKDEEGEDIFYSCLFLHRSDNVGSDFDPVTGLYGKVKFHKYVSRANQKYAGNDAPAYAIVFLNLVNFKLLNIEKGVVEGDECLKVMADTLRDAYGEAFISRISGDHFAVFTKYDHVFEKTEEAAKRFYDTYGNQFDLIGKFGIYRLDFSEDFDVESALSLAKVACDFIKYDPETDIVEYSEMLAEEIKTKEYVVGKIDEAIEKGWIKVYYQPVVRSLTGWLCGVESLARWIDPEIGFLPPDKFIGTLERERCIHKLDSYIVEQVCMCIHDRLEKGEPVVPVSVNFSRMDFLMCDMLQMVEKAVEKYDIPRDYIHIEITESMLASDAELMERVIKSFREAGYEVWMDDFGSGYSSLNLLKDYHFDTLKMDMCFLTPFTDRSKSIMRSVVTMAKDIGIKTLAEGVETKEQLEFLKEIGCGMIQGYYYGKPEPVESTYAHIAEKFIPIETRKWRHFYEVAASQVRVTDVPLELVEDDGNEFKTIFMNQSYIDQIFEPGTEMELEEIDRRIYHTKSPLLQKYREMADHLERTREPETFYYADNENYLRFYGECIAEHSGRYLLKGSLTNITIDQKGTERERLDSKLRDLHFLFEDIYLLDLSERTVIPLMRESKDFGEEEVIRFDLKESIDGVVGEKVFPSERIRCQEFLDAFSLRDRVDRSGKGYISEIFRFRKFDGSYQMKEVFIMMIPGTGANEYLYCVKPYKVREIEKAYGSPSAAHGSDQESGDIRQLEEYANLWKNLMWNSEIKIFWKDKERRIQGVSPAFLQFYGIDSLEEIIGKTDEQMHWHIDGEKHIQDELEVLRKGKRLIYEPALSIARGVVQHIMCTKLPIYREGEIVGLVGFFVDRDTGLKKLQSAPDELKVDPVTRLMNAKAFMDALYDYARQYRDNGKKYGVIVFQNTKHHRIKENYGKEFSDKVLKRIADVLVGVTGQKCVTARTKKSVFAVLTFSDDRQKLCVLAEELEAKISGITSVDGSYVTIRMKYSVKYRTDEGINDENMYERALEEILGKE